MLLNHVWGLLANPKKEWKSIKNARAGIFDRYVSHVLPLSAIPVVAAFLGTTRVGWQIGEGDSVKLTLQSAWPMALVTYLTMLVAVFLVGTAINWMGKTYHAKQNLNHAVALAAYTATPLWLVGIMFLYPLLWLNMLLGLVALTYTVYLLYTGLPIMMGINAERGFLYSSAVLAFGLVMLVGLLALSVILWGHGIGPHFVQ